MKSINPRTRRSFLSPGDELAYLYSKLEYWHIERGDRRMVVRYLDRFATLLRACPRDSESIAHQMYWSLYCQLSHDYPGAVEHKRREIASIERLLADYGPTSPVDHEYLALEYLDLGWLYFDLGFIDASRAQLKRAKQISQEGGFDLGDIGLETVLAKSKE